MQGSWKGGRGPGIGGQGAVLDERSCALEVNYFRDLAEGHSRASTKEYLHHVSIAQPSLAELETQLELAIRLQYGECAEFQRVLDHRAVLGKQLYKLRRRV